MVCNKRMLLDEHPLGLVFKDKHFLCEKCHDDHSDEELHDWIKTKMNDPKKGMPISLWLIHEQNKDKTFMTRTIKK